MGSQRKACYGRARKAVIKSAASAASPMAEKLSETLEEIKRSGILSNKFNVDDELEKIEEENTNQTEEGNI